MLFRKLLIVLSILSFMPSAAIALNVGYYDMELGTGSPDQITPITTAGHSAISMDNVAAADLVGIDILFVQNPSNNDFGAEYLGNLADIQSWVSNGGRLVIHDRYVTGAASILPGGGAFDFQRETGREIDGSNAGGEVVEGGGSGDANDLEVLDNSTLITNGPHGVIDNNSLDGGSSSSHGYALSDSLTATSLLVISRPNPIEIVTFAYAFDQGMVLYSSIPLDFYLGQSAGSQPGDNLSLIYTPNVLAFAAAFFNGPPAIIPSLSKINLMVLGFIMLLIGLVTVSKKRSIFFK
jgi:hypothetical protein